MKTLEFKETFKETFPRYEWMIKSILILWDSFEERTGPCGRPHTRLSFFMFRGNLCIKLKKNCIFNPRITRSYIVEGFINKYHIHMDPSNVARTACDPSASGKLMFTSWDSIAMSDRLMGQVPRLYQSKRLVFAEQIATYFCVRLCFISL